MLRIGCSQSDITPTPPILTGGTFVKIQCSEIHDPLMASCVVADDGRTRVAIASCDLGNLSRDLVDSIRDQASIVTGTPRESIHITATHNHSAPTIFPKRDTPFADDEQWSQIERTRTKIVADITECIIKAHETLVPARMGYGCGRFDGGAWNRRFIMSNGRSRMHGGNNLECLKPEGPVDPEVQAVWFIDSEDRPLAVMVNYSSHATNLYGQPKMSADFPGVMRDALQGILGKDVPVLYLQGCCGNVMCADIENPNRTKGMANARRIGLGLAGETLRIMSDNFVFTRDAAVTGCNRSLNVPYRDILPLPIEVARTKWAYYRDHWDEFRQLDVEDRAAIGCALRVDGYKQSGVAEEVEISAFAIGDVLFVTNPAELFVEYQLDIKERFRGRKVIVIEQTDGRIGYVPTRLACALGGYETIQTRFNPDAGEWICDASCELIERLIELQEVLGGKIKESTAQPAGSGDA